MADGTRTCNEARDGSGRSPRWARVLAFALLLLAVGAVQPTNAWADDRPAFPAARFDAAVTEALGDLKVVGISAAAVVRGEVVHARGYGFADRENAVPMTAKTRLRWASISKPLTAVRAMQLWEQERLDLDRDVRGYVPSFPEKPHAVTARQLLCHQGGIVHYRNGQVVRTKRTYETDNPFACVVTALDRFQESPLVCEPGTRYSYTTHGYMLLGAVVERAGEARFADQVAEHIAKPLGMTTLAPDYQWESIPDRAKGYRGFAGVLIPSTDTDVSWKLAGGGFISSAEDLARFGGGLLEHKLVKPETRALMWTRQKTSDGKETGYGLGFSVRKRDGRLVAEHGGAQEKVATLLVLDADARVGIALLCNTEGAKLGALGHSLLDLVRQATAATTAPRPGEPARPRAPRESPTPSR